MKITNKYKKKKSMVLIILGSNFGLYLLFVIAIYLIGYFGAEGLEYRTIDRFIPGKRSRTKRGTFDLGGMSGWYDISFYKNNDNIIKNLGGNILVYSVYINNQKDKILYFITDKETFCTEPEVDKEDPDTTFINIKERYWKLYWNKGEYEHWKSTDMIPKKEKEIFIKMENTLSNWVKSGKIKLGDSYCWDKIISNEGKVLMANTNFSREGKSFEYYKMK